MATYNLLDPVNLKKAIYQAFMTIIGIMAATPQGIIGNDKGLPWHYPKEVSHFKSTIQGYPLIMGRKTYEHMPKKLLIPNKTLIFSRQELPAPFSTIPSLDKCLDQLRHFSEKKVYMIGGAEIAHLFLSQGLISSFILTRIHLPYPGTVRLNLSYFHGWKERVLTSHPAYTILHLKKPL